MNIIIKVRVEYIFENEILRDLKINSLLFTASRVSEYIL